MTHTHTDHMCQYIPRPALHCPLPQDLSARSARANNSHPASWAVRFLWSPQILSFPYTSNFCKYGKPNWKLSCVQLFVNPWITALQASLSITNSLSSLKLMSIKSVMPSSHLILYHPLLLLIPIPLSIKVFFNESTVPMWWPKYWSFSFQHQSFQWIFIHQRSWKRKWEVGLCP